MQKWQCRISNTLGGGFAGTPNQVWGTRDYKNNTDPTVFFGCYGLPDLMAVRSHKGRKAILWAGTDITYLINGYWLDDNGEFRLDPKVVGAYLNKNVENWCENELERKELESVGIKAQVCPSYLGDVKKIKPVNKADTPMAYISVSGDDFKAYGWDHIDDFAKDNPHITIYCYGNKSEWKSEQPNVVVRGRVSQEVMNKEISKMHFALRFNQHDGFSEVLAKGILLEQLPVYKNKDLGYWWFSLGPKKAREWFIKNVNKYPWNTRS